MGRPGKRGLMTGWRGSAALADKRLDCTVAVYMSEESKERVTVLRVGKQHGAAPRVRAAKSSEFGEEKL